MKIALRGRLNVRAALFILNASERAWPIFAPGKNAAPPGLPHFPRLAGVIAALLGLTAVIGWEAHWRLAVQLLPDGSPMHFNTMTKAIGTRSKRTSPDIQVRPSAMAIASRAP
ncbi:MAG TPA: hypothetical protein VG347_07770 [Verrucomicrobiae bacterium]|nr:hypothetical protein [Verrucomicrobiae bacterium]